MMFRSFTRACCAAATLCAMASIAYAADASAAKSAAIAGKETHPDYVRYVGDNQRGKLETAVVTLRNAAGAKVDLIGAVHIADAAYYQTLMRLFSGYEALLFELVDGQKLRESVEGQAEPRARRGKPGDVAKVPPRPDAPAEEENDEKDAGHNNPAFAILRMMMHGVGSYLRLQYQTDGIDYHTKNFVHADVSMDEFVRLQAEKGESFLQLFQKAFEAQLGRGTKKDEEPTGGQLLLALLGDSSGIKIAMARMLGKAESLGEELGFGPDSVIVGERNRVALEIFDKQVKAGRKNLGIFYGAAHLPDMERRLEQRGFHRAAEQWITAWDIKPRVEEEKARAAEPQAKP
jgi:hypothetical protein